MRTDYDSPWKTILTLYFRDCLAFYFPQAEQGIDWRTPPIFLDKELEKLLADDQGGAMRVDKLAQVKLLDGTESWVLLHLEIQTQRQREFTERLYRYNSRLYGTHRTPVATFAILCDASPTWRPTSFAYELLGFQLRLDFPVAKLLDYKSQASQLTELVNPFALVTLAHLEALATKPDDPARKNAKFRLIRLLLERGYQRQEIYALFRFIDWVLWLDPDLEKEFEADVALLEKERNVEYISSMERRAIDRGLERGLAQGLERGLEQGLVQGKMLGQRQLLLQMMQLKFGELPPEMLAYVASLEDEGALTLLGQRLLTAVSLEDMQIPEA
jgi:hypothetical protein